MNPTPKLLLLAFLLSLHLASPSAKAIPVVAGDRELLAGGDFNGDGAGDLVIVDRTTGKYRLGYQLSPGSYTWVNWRPSGLKDVSGLSLGRLLDPQRDALVFASADANAVTVVDAGNTQVPGTPATLPISFLGPMTAIAVDIGGAGNTPLADLYICSIYNSPEPNVLSLLRNSAGQFVKLTDLPLKGALAHGNRLALKAGQPAEFIAFIESGDEGDSLRIESLTAGKPEVVASAPNLPSGAEYTYGSFRGVPTPDFVVYLAGDTNLLVHSLEEPTAGTYRFLQPKTFGVPEPIREVTTLAGEKRDRLFVLFGEGESGAVYDFDATAPPKLVNTVSPPADEQLSGAVSCANGFLTFSWGAQVKAKQSTRYQFYTFDGTTNSTTPFGRLASLADTDDSTVPEIQQRIAAGVANLSEADMKPYTNTIPGSDVTYVMVPIPGGEYLRGSPDSETGRKPEEGPQHRVRISPFWMGAFEVTWNEYELFMYPDDERKLRETFKSEPYVDKVSDAVTRPSKPYVEMSFGMGKNGFPAICMTQHAANKYCHWLSSKTGHYYRLPTEAEWEHACRAGTKTAYSFGDDPSQLTEYAWYEQNSDFKYQKVGKKKPNPWGLYDIHGNVTEWCLDQYDTNAYAGLVTGLAENPWNKATLPYPHVVRGGSWDDDATKLRSAARRGSERAWKMRDPQLPKSIWWHSDAQFVGFRLVRPLKAPEAPELQKYWTSGVEKD